LTCSQVDARSVDDRVDLTLDKRTCSVPLLSALSSRPSDAFDQIRLRTIVSVLVVSAVDQFTCAIKFVFFDQNVKKDVQKRRTV